MTSDAERPEPLRPRLVSAIRYSGFVAVVLAAVLTLLSLVLEVPPATRNVGLAGAAVVLVLAVYSVLVTRAIEDAVAPAAPEAPVPAADMGAIMGALDEAVVYRDASGTVCAINSRLADIFAFSTDPFIGRPHVELLREIARSMEDPEAVMEAYQTLIEDPSAVLAYEFDQVMPEQRQLRFVSRPASPNDRSAGRVDVITDISEASRRAGQVERLLDQSRRTAESYQRGLLPQSIPRLPRIGLVAHYVAASGDKGVCGDFYDFVPFPDGQIGLVLGDVCGSGPQAASDGALTRYSLRSFATEEPGPGALFERLNRHVAHNLPAERFARALLCVLDPERATLDYINAGHVPPVIYRAADDRVEWLSEGGIALGIEEDTQFKPTTMELEPGDVLVLYSDGVTEAPRRGRPFGQGRFGDLVKDWSRGSAGELVQAVRRAVEAWVPEGELRDDLALVVCQVVPDDTLNEPTRELVLPNEAARSRDVRAFVASFLADVRAPVELSNDVLVAVGEAAANATRHGRRDNSRSEVRIRCAVEGADVTVTIADDGPGFDPGDDPGEELPDRFAPGGRGLYLMRHLVDQASFDSSQGGTTVTLRRRVFEAGEGPGERDT
jgi:serine phosphatase RsbU (regulator of sigma subunit)/anti-sigma regulatory factor (Ser/Thr protein kinase)